MWAITIKEIQSIRVFFFLIISPKTVPTPKKRNHHGEGLALSCDSAEIVSSIPNRVSSTPISSDLMSEDD